LQVLQERDFAQGNKVVSIVEIGENMAEKKKSSLVEVAKKRAAAPAPKKQSGGFKEYFKGVMTETKKVVWPTKKEAFSYTVVVLVACVFFGLVIWGLDTGFLAGLRELLKIKI
jgi:preprotein translocase subunit SecE